MDALMQLNLMIWLAWGNVPEDDSIKPIFRQKGFDLFAIAPEIPIPLALQQAMRNRLGVYKQSVAPDLLLLHREHPEFLILECKESSFSSSSSSKIQALGYLIVTGTRMAIDFGVIPPTSHTQYDTLVCYVVNGGQEIAMFDTLQSLQTELRDNKFNANETNALGIYEKGNSVFLTQATEGCLPENDFLVVKESASVFPLIPWDPSLGENKEAKRDLEERLRSYFVSFLGANLEQAVQSPLDISVDELLREAIWVWDYWKDRSTRRNIKRAARRFLVDILKRLSEKTQLTYKSTHNGWQIVVPEYNDIEDIRRMLSGSTMRQLPIPFDEYKGIELWDDNDSS